MDVARLDGWLTELDERNRDNLTRTESYLELYAWTRANGCELPWVLMAHLVSRNAGYQMSDLGRHLARGADPVQSEAVKWLFVLLERGNFLIFWDAWFHVLHALAGRVSTLTPPRTPRFMIDAWARYQRDGGERQLVIDLVTNEQNLIERRAVHNPALIQGRRLVELIEGGRREQALHFPLPDVAQIFVGGFSRLDRRIHAGTRIYDEVVADRGRRDALFEWAVANPHTGSRSIYGGKAGPTVRAVWPYEAVRRMWDPIHAPAEPDPLWP
jgi:hypothetical protein